MVNHYHKSLKITEEWAAYLWENQTKESTTIHNGAFTGNYRDRLARPKESIYALNVLVAVYYCPDSKYYRNEDLANRIELLLAYIERVQRPDGNFDLPSVNYYSAPDTAFMTQRLNTAYRVIAQYGQDERSTGLKKRLYQIIKKAGTGICQGGFHTPNHRWVIAAALMMSYNLVGVELFKDSAEKYLAEGIDCNQDGEFSERSTGIYNAVNDNALILLSEATGRGEFLEYVRKNLEMIILFLEPDGSLYTGNSTRQDQASKFYPDNYYHLYLEMADRCNNGRFAEMARKIIEDQRYQLSLKNIADSFHIFMLRPALQDFKVKSELLPVNFKKHYRDSGVVRVRRGKMSFTITENSSEFLVFKVGQLRLYLKICASFFCIGQFNADQSDQRWRRASKTGRIQPTPDGYQMDFAASGCYYLPFEDLTAELEWGDMRYADRKTTGEIKLSLQIIIKEIEQGLELLIKSAGCDRVPIKLEFGITPGCIVEGESYLLDGIAGQSMVAKSGQLRLQKDEDIIQLGPAFGRHWYTDHMRGSEPPSKNDFIVYFTDFTNIDRKITIVKR